MTTSSATTEAPTMPPIAAGDSPLDSASGAETVGGTAVVALCAPIGVDPTEGAPATAAVEGALLEGGLPPVAVEGGFVVGAPVEGAGVVGECAANEGESVASRVVNVEVVVGTSVEVDDDGSGSSGQRGTPPPNMHTQRGNSASHAVS